MKERIMGKGSIKGRLGKDDQAAETKDPADKSCLAQNAHKTQIYTPATHFSKCGFTCMRLDHQICKQTHDIKTNPDVEVRLVSGNSGIALLKENQ